MWKKELFKLEVTENSNYVLVNLNGFLAVFTVHLTLIIITYDIPFINILFNIFYFMCMIVLPAFM